MAGDRGNPNAEVHPSTGLCSFPQCVSDSFVNAEDNAEVKRRIHMGRTAVRIDLEAKAGIPPNVFF